jgi:hypothetical protein
MSREDSGGRDVLVAHVSRDPVEKGGELVRTFG